MFAKRIQLINYGPIDRLDISFPFDGDSPKPIVLVGENGSGKSILLSHIVNGLLLAQGIAYPETREVEENKVYKLRHDYYIRSGSNYYISRVDFESGLYVEEFRSKIPKKDFAEAPEICSTPDVGDFWKKLKSADRDYLSGEIFHKEDKVKSSLSKNVVLYFPPNRFEEPAWLNQENLLAKAQYMALKNLQGYTSRRIVNYSPLRSNQNWLFELVYDRNAFELQTIPIPFQVSNDSKTHPLPVFKGYSGPATSVYGIALSIVQEIMERQDARFGIGPRHNRVVSVESASGSLCSNIFQMSSGETSLLNLFFTILRDFDLTDSSFSSTEDIRGIVVVDEIDLHLHARHQHEILPKLMQMFPNIQFVVTTHSPLFVLGLHNTFGEDGFALYDLPNGKQISAEEFSEFGWAYQSFTGTRKFGENIRKAIEKSLKPIIFVEGKTDIKYIVKAAEHLEQLKVLDKIQLRDGQGFGGLNKVSKHFDTALSEITPQDIILLYDCDKPKMDSQGNVHRRHIPLQENNPVEEGIENLFSRETLLKAREFKKEFIDVTSEHKETIRGESRIIPEKWTINPDEKTNLCNWICENGTSEDFQHFHCVYDLLEEILGIAEPFKAVQP